jgi:hypothetical protein
MGSNNPFKNPFALTNNQHNLSPPVPTLTLQNAKSLAMIEEAVPNEIKSL